MESGFMFNWDSDSEEEFFGFLEDELDVVCVSAEEEEEEGEGEDNLTVCGGEGDAPREWLDVTGEMVATEEERKRSDGRTPFNETNPRPGPQRIWSSTDPHEFFSSFFSSEVVDLIVVETNRYIEALVSSSELAINSRFRDFKKTDRAEIETFLAIQIWMGLLRKPQISDYWSTCQDSLGLTPNFARVMTRNRFQLLSSCQHFCDNTQRVERDQPGYDPLFKIRPLMELVLAGFQD
ncbi:hypothetical protein ACEWY4_003948 [Coilia grayii]|uniref:PiggyBac transposable element-derived protein domain-containing protein n=1 Tax=Coilia grayii TaxID=363190 RepID=A0ABD1KK45_9TELE